MAIEFEEISIQNFMSFGNSPEVIPLHSDQLTLVLGENLDKGEDTGERNGTGKSSIIMAIHFALFGQSIGNKIKKPNLINKTNQRNCEVILKFSRGTNRYTIKRCRKPEKLEFYVDDHLVNEQGGDEGQGEMKDTQLEIARVLGTSTDMFNQTVLLSTYEEPFLSLSNGKQRDLIEELLGITQLSDKASSLKEMLKETKTQLDKEDFKIKTLQETNARIIRNHEKTVSDLQKRSEKWILENTKVIDQLNSAIASLSKIDIELEIKEHENLTAWLTRRTEQDRVLAELERLNFEKGRHDKAIQQAEKRLIDIDIDLSRAQENKCPTCGQDVHDENHSSVLSSIKEKKHFYQDQLRQETDSINVIYSKLTDLEKVEFNLGPKPEVFYDEAKDAYNHKSNLRSLQENLRNEEQSINPYREQIEALAEAPIQEINVELRDDLIQLRDHQDFLLKLLTNKDSTVRKRIIDQNISYLNSRLGLYLEKLGLPHEVEFLNDMTTQITQLGNDYDFASLSRGERARLSLALSFSFRDVWESLNEQSNLLFIDEVLDNGIDSSGIEAALKVLKTMGRERKKNIFIVSHREELISRCSNVMSVVKEGGFSHIEWSRDEIA
jgi:DNA repair exonuclease SbcCD ATPase subunit